MGAKAVRSPASNPPSNPPPAGPPGEDTPSRFDWCSVIDLVDVPEGEKVEIKEWIRESKNRKIEILVTGRTGVGKSTLVNGLVGEEVAEVGRQLHATTMDVQGYELKTQEGIEVIVWDSPGLQDGSGNEEKYLAEMKEKL